MPLPGSAASCRTACATTSRPASTPRSSAGKEHALDEPVRAGGNHHDRAGEGHAVPERRRSAAGSRRAALATSSTTASWPISTPKLNENSDQPSASRGRPNSRSTLAKPNPCTRPNVKRHPRAQIAAITAHEVVGAHEDDAQRDRRLDDRSAAARRCSSAASDSVMLWPIVNAVTMRTQRPPAAAEQQQADEKQDVIGPDQDVMRCRTG